MQSEMSQILEGHDIAIGLVLPSGDKTRYAAQSFVTMYPDIEVSQGILYLSWRAGEKLIVVLLVVKTMILFKYMMEVVEVVLCEIRLQRPLYGPGRILFDDAGELTDFIQCFLTPHPPMWKIIKALIIIPGLAGSHKHFDMMKPSLRDRNRQQVKLEIVIALTVG